MEAASRPSEKKLLEGFRGEGRGLEKGISGDGEAERNSISAAWGGGQRRRRASEAERSIIHLNCAARGERKLRHEKAAGRLEICGWHGVVARQSLLAEGLKSEHHGNF